MRKEILSMNLSDLRKSDAFSNSDDSKDARRYTAYNAVTNMIYYARELIQNYNEYESADKNSRYAHIVFSAIRDNLNNYVQTFMDCAIVLCETPSGTLRGLIRAFLSQYSLDNNIRSWVEFLIRRNDLIHDYLSYDFLNDELYSALVNYNQCILELAQFINQELQEKNLLEVKIRK